MNDAAMPRWPLVVPNDDGIRPAGKPDQCLYCKSRIGEPHALDCVVVKKVVRLKYTIEVDVQVPHSWSADDINFHRNESSWCAGNAVDEIVQQAKSGGGCLCARFSSQLVEVVDDTPRRKINE